MQLDYVFKSSVIPPEPKHQSDACRHEDFQDWIDAEWIEMDTVYGMGTIKFVHVGLLPMGVSLIPTKFAYKCKFGSSGEEIKKKARLCVRGDLQKEAEYTETYTPTSRFNTLRTLISIVCQENLKLVQFDVKGAFCVSQIEDKDIYIQLPPGYEAPEGYVAKLACCLYGLQDSAYLFHKTLSDWMVEYGFEPLDPDRMMFKLVKGDSVLIVVLYVNDGLVAHNSDDLYKEFIKDLSELFELSADAAEVAWYLGVSVKCDCEKGTIKLSQEQYVNDLLKRFGMQDCNPILTPMEVGQHLTSEDCPVVPNKDVVKHYQQLVGSLNYLVVWTWPELAFAVSQCARFMSNPGLSHVAAAKRILRYTKGCKTLGIMYTRDCKVPNQLYAFVDADHAGNIEGRQSVTGYVVMLNGGAVSWESKRQKVTALSSAEAEYYAVSAAGCDIAYLRRVMKTMGFAQQGPTLVAEDNISCIYMSKSSAMYHKGKHIDVRVYRLQEFVHDGIMELYHITSAEQAADGLTKSLPSEATSRHAHTMSGCVRD